MVIPIEKNEKVKDVEEYDGRYAITTTGRVWSYPKKGIKGGASEHKGKWMKQNKTGRYLKVGLFKDGIRKTKDVHRLVAKAFCFNPKPLMYTETNHKDGNRRNDTAGNLEWCTHKYNIKHAYKIGLISANTGPANEAMKKRIIQYSKTGKMIKIWTSIAEVERIIGFNNANISACCKGRLKTAYGYMWKYA